jgi:two-component sensor histidine kinase
MGQNRQIPPFQDSIGEAEKRALQYDILFENMSEGFALCDAIRDRQGELTDYVILEINLALQKMLGVGPEVAGTKLSDSGNNTPEWLQRCDAVLRTGTPSRFEFHNRRTERWHEIRLVRVTDNRMAQFFHDITERKIAEARQRELFEELNHRVKNNLTMISAVLRLQARDAHPVVHDQLLKAVGRVQSISEVYRNLYADGQSGTVEFAQYLEELCDSLAASLLDDPERVTLHVEAETASIPVDTAVPLGMVVNELITNAAKYAYPPPQRGEISVRFEKDGADYTLEIGDSGVGLPENAEVASPGLGMKLVHSLVQQAGGRLTITRHPGVTYAIHFPALAADGS